MSLKINIVSRDSGFSKIWPIILAGLLVLLLLAVAFLRHGLSPIVRNWTVNVLRDHYRSDLSFKQLEVLSVFPEVRVRGEEVVLYYKGRKDVPPLASFRKFYAEGSLFDFLQVPRRFRRLELDGLEINVVHTGARSEGHPQKKLKLREISPFMISEVVADGAVLNIIPQRADKPPHTFTFSKLRLRSAGIGQAMSFRATLTNATPPGLIETNGKFGPWQVDEPGNTPLSGTYTFQHADLSVFRGISGTLSSEGKYKGQLDRIEAQGKTDTPDFTLKISGHPVHLVTDFKAIVDGKNGDTQLMPVNAHFLNTTLVCEGSVQGKPGVPGKIISLDVTVSRGRVEDLIRISVKSEKPALVGDVNLHTKFVLPPGGQEILEKLKLNGEFQVRQARFTSPEIEQKVESLSRHGEGLKNAPQDENVTSNFQGHMELKNSVTTLSGLIFAVPGAQVSLDGNYGLMSEKLDFHGNLRLQAKVSQMTTGIKSILLRAIDPLFEKHGAGTFLPLDITGTREHPSFKVDIRRAISGR